MLRAGLRIAERYEIISPIGAGGMGVVFSARRLALDDVVALKIIHPDNDSPHARARFVREARAMARIRHPNVVQVFDFGDPPAGQGEPAYLVMELLRGPTLADVVANGPMPPDRLVEAFVDICSAVEAGHRRGVVHRDLKPGNVVLSTDDDGGESIKVLDFGLARILESETGRPPTATMGPGSGAIAGIVGTIAYMSPEQIEGGDATTASDVWALGVLLFELATGALPFRGRTPVAAIMKIADVDYPDPAGFVVDLPPGVVQGISAALKHDPSKRPASPLALAEIVAQRTLNVRSAAPLDAAPPTLDAARAPWTRDSAALGLGQSSDQMTQGPAAGDAPGSRALVARDHVFEALEDELDAARNRRSCRVVVIRGDPGSGKTSVLERFSSQARRGAVVLHGRFYLYEGDRPPPGETYGWMLEESAAGGHPLARPGEPETDRWRRFDELARRFAGRASDGRPLLIALDDVQWATRLELEFLDYLFRALDDRPAVILMTARESEARTDARSELSAWILRFARQHPGRLSSLMLDAFDDEEILAWLRTRLDHPRIQPAEIRRLRRLTGGNPAYLEEVLRHLQANGAIVSERIATRVRVDDAELPASVAQALLANLSDLDADVRGAVEAASVIGEELRFETLLATTGTDEDVLEELLERACDRGVLSDRGTSAGADYRFVSPALRAALYENIPRRRRRRLHRAVVGALEHLYARDRRRIAKILCIHHHATENWPATLEWGLLATRASLSAFDADSAAASLARCELALRELDGAGSPAARETAEATRLLRGMLDNRIGQYERADQTLGTVAEAARERRDDATELRAVLERVDSQMGRGELVGACETGTRALELAEAGQDPSTIAQARVLLGSVMARLGAYDEVTRVLAPVLDDREPERFRERARALREQAWAESRRGEMQRADALSREVMGIADSFDDPLARYYAVSLQALVQAEGGHAEAAVPLYAEAQRMARALSLRRREMIETANMAMSLSPLGRNDEALQSMLQARALCEELGDKASLGDSMIGTAQILIARGDLDEAAHALESGLRLADETGRAEYALIATVELGDVELSRQEPRRAEAWFRDALLRLEAVESHYAWRAHAGLARALAAAEGEPEQRRTSARVALALIDEVQSRRVEGADEAMLAMRDQMLALAELESQAKPNARPT
jgi:serine/threonine protein kinase/tetratricopeptide (TPR) repeat protein